MKHQRKQNGNDDADQVFVLDLKTEFHLSSRRFLHGRAPLYTATPRNRRLGHIAEVEKLANRRQLRGGLSLHASRRCWMIGCLKIDISPRGHMRQAIGKHLIGTCLLGSGIIMNAQVKPVDPEAAYAPQQHHFCDVFRSVLVKQSQNANLNPMQKAQAPPPPDAKEMSRQLMTVLGPSLEFSGWRGYFLGTLHDREVSVQFVFSCFIYGPDGRSPLNTRVFKFMSPAGRDGQDIYPGTRWLSLSDPIVQKLTALPNNGGDAIVSGHLFPAKQDPSYVADPTRMGFGEPLDGGPALATFTSVTFVSKK